MEYGTSVDKATQQPRVKLVSYHEFLLFEGELTHSRTLYCVLNDDYLVLEGEQHFSPPARKVFCKSPSRANLTLNRNGVSRHEIRDALRRGVYRGNISDADCNSVIEKEETAAVTVMIKSISIISSNLNHGGRCNACYADIVFIDKVYN